MTPYLCVKITRVCDPDPAEIPLINRSLGVGENRRNGTSPQTPQLAAKMRCDSTWKPPFEAKRPLQAHRQIKQPALAFPGKGKVQVKPFFVQSTDAPRDI